ncbi:MAG: WbqC family protein [Kofleriaceae bacterium]
MPWLGYLDKMAKADLFVIMDDLQYESQNFQNRQRLKLAGGATWLVVPLERGSHFDRVLDKKIDNGGNAKQNWQRRTWLTIEYNYRRAPYWDDYAPEIHALFHRRWDTLLELNLHMLELARQWFAITTPMVRASTLGLTGQKTDRLIHMCHAVNARCYLTGSGGSSDYLDSERMGRSGIGVIWQHFRHPIYQQRFAGRGFVSHLGFLDLLLNVGPAARELLFERTHPITVAA